MTAVDEAKIQLAVPAAARSLGARVRLRWQVGLGQLVEADHPIARLDGDAGKGSLLLQVPSDCRGAVAEHWVTDGAEVMVGEPVVTLVAMPTAAQAAGLAEEVPAGFRPTDRPELGGLRQTDVANHLGFDIGHGVPARRLSGADRIALAAVGCSGLLGLACAALALPLFLVMRDGTAALLAAGSLAIVAAGLTYGKERLDRVGG